MASHELRTDKNGNVYYLIVARNKSGNKVKTTWHPEKGWSQRYIDQQLRRLEDSFETQVKAGDVLNRKEQAEADAAAALLEARIQTVKQYGEQVFMPLKISECAENTRQYYQNALSKHIYPELGSIKLPDLNTAMITAFFLRLQNSDLSYSTVIGIYITLNQLLKMAYLTDMISRNPMDKVQRPKRKKQEKAENCEIKAYTAEEINYILDCLQKEPLKWRTLIELMIDTGIRRGEACGLKWSCVDFENNEITISGNLCYTKDKGVYLDVPKTGKIRSVCVSSEVMQLLQNLQIQQKKDIRRRTDRLKREGKPLEIKKVTFSEYVFTEKGSSDPIHPQSPTRYLKELEKKYGITDFHPHKLRHSFASIAITNGADIASVSEILGHADKGTTLRMYTHADKESMKKASNTFRDALKAKNKQSKAKEA